MPQRKPHKPYKPLNFRSLGNNPPEATSAPAGDVDSALAMVAEITDSIDDASESVVDRAAEFFESVREGAVAIGKTIEETRRVTPPQQKALDNWLAGVKKWTDNDRD